MSKEYNWLESTGAKIDPATGMPELPEGYFWRVKQGYAYAINVQLRKRVMGRLSVVVENSVNDDPTPWGVRNLAAYVLYRWETSTARKQEEAAIQNLYGDYPPKKLGNN